MADTLYPTFAELRSDFSARGFAYLDGSTSDQARRDRMINQGQKALCLEDEWPFLITTTSPSTAPITLTDVREIHSVVSSTTELQEADRDEINDGDPLMSQTGTAQYFWRDGPQTIRVYPLDTSTTWTVRYLKVPATMTAATDVPTVPDDWRFLIVDYAVIQALRDRSNFEEARALYDSIQPDLNRMREALVDLPWTQKTTGVC
jgi:hypothetical protein